MFLNRKEAGKLLAEKLKDMGVQGSIILGLPRGGVPVAFEIAKIYKAPLDVLIVRKIGAPFFPELAIGAMGEDQVPVLNQKMIGHLNLKDEEVQEVICLEKKEVKRQMRLFRRYRKALDFQNKNVIVVDDGLATGATACAAVKYLKNHGAGQITLAVPVAATESSQRLRQVADRVVTVEESEDFLAVSHWYYDFDPVPDETVVRLLVPPKKNRREASGSIRNDSASAAP